jgi:hypothetical protein
MLWVGIKYPIYSFQSKSDRIIFITRRVKARFYIYSLQLNSIRSNPLAKQNDVNGELKTRYMLRPGIKYPMYSFQSKSDWMIFIIRHVKASFYIYSLQLNSIGTNPLAKQNDVIGELKTRYMLRPGITYAMYSFQSTCDWKLFIPIMSKLYHIYSSQLNSIGTNPHAKQKKSFANSKRVICCGQEKSTLSIHSNQSLI